MTVVIGSEALSSGELTRHELRTYYRRLHPDVYAPKRADLTLEDRIAAAWLWSRRRGVVCGLAASALHGAKWVDVDVPIELAVPNRRPTAGVVTRNCTFSEDEVTSSGGMELTTVDRTAFDLACSGPARQAVARLDALAAATHFKREDVRNVARRHPGARRIGRLDTLLDLVDAGAESPQETRVRLLLLDNGFPRPATQIPVSGPNCFPRYYLDVGWEDIMVAVEYDGEHHRRLSEGHRAARIHSVARLDRCSSGGRQSSARHCRAGAGVHARRDCVDGAVYSHFVATVAVSTVG